MIFLPTPLFVDSMFFHPLERFSNSRVGNSAIALPSLNDLFTAPLGKPTFSCTLTGKGWMTKEAALANVRTTASSANPLFEKTEK